MLPTSSETMGRLTVVDSVLDGWPQRRAFVSVLWLLYIVLGGGDPGSGMEKLRP